MEVEVEVEGGKMRIAFAVETGSKIVVVEGWRAAWSQVRRAGEDQFASATKMLGRCGELWKSDVARSLMVGCGMASSMDMSAMARERSLFALLTATYCAVLAGLGRVLIPAVDMPSSSNWLRAARPLKSSPTALCR